MADRIIKIDKSTVSNQVAGKSIDRSFVELIPKEEIVSLDQFFDYYNQLFYNIPKNGTLSHKTLIDQSTDYYGNYVDIRDQQILDLNAEIAALNQQLLNLETSQLDVSLPEEKTIKIYIKQTGPGNKAGTAKTRNAKTIKLKYFDANGNNETKSLNFINIRGNKYVATFKSIPGTIRYELDGYLKKSGADWKFKSGQQSYIINEDDPDVIDITLKVDAYK